MSKRVREMCITVPFQENGRRRRQQRVVGSGNKRLHETVEWCDWIQVVQLQLGLFIFIVEWYFYVFFFNNGVFSSYGIKVCLGLELQEKGAAKFLILHESPQGEVKAQGQEF